MAIPQYKSPNWRKYSVLIAVLALLSQSVSMAFANGPLSFEKAIKVAQQSDPWLTGNKHQQKALESMGDVTSTLPDPKISIGFANLPVDGFDLNQEGMTQAKVGITQMFPRGDSLGIKSKQFKIQSEAFPYQRKDRAAKVAVTVGSLWLNAYLAQESIALIENNRSLFEQLAGAVEASYTSSLGKTRQQDIVRAQLELTRLDDRLDKLAQQKNQYEGMLLQWLMVLPAENKKANDISPVSDLALYDLALNNIALTAQLPNIDLIHQNVVEGKKELNIKQLLPYFSNHPSVIALDKKIQASKTGIALAEQKYKPEWGINASYGYRADDLMGQSRADLFSVGVTFDLPVFTENRQDKEVQSAVSTTEAVKTEKLLLLRQLLSAYSSAKGRLHRLKERQYLYKYKLLPQSYDQAQASLSAFTHDDGDFAEVVSARIQVLNAEVDAIALDVEQQKIHLELNYLFIGSLNTMPNLAFNTSQNSVLVSATEKFGRNKQ